LVFTKKNIGITLKKIIPNKIKNNIKYRLFLTKALSFSEIKEKNKSKIKNNNKIKKN